MPEIIKMVKFKTNVSFVGSDGVLYFGGNVVQLPRKDFEDQVEVCEQFGLTTPELIEEIDVVVDKGEVSAAETPKNRNKNATQPVSEAPEGDDKVDVSEL